MVGGERPALTEAFLRAAYGDNLTGRASRSRVAELLNFYADEAAQQKTAAASFHHDIAAMEADLIGLDIAARAGPKGVALVKAWKADTAGNLVYRKTARNFNPAVAMAGKVCVVEVEEIVETGAIAPDHVHLPGIYVHRIVLNASPEKRIEKRTITEKAGV